MLKQQILAPLPTAEAKLDEDSLPEFGSSRYDCSTAQHNSRHEDDVYSFCKSELVSEDEDASFVDSQPTEKRLQFSQGLRKLRTVLGNHLIRKQKAAFEMIKAVKEGIRRTFNNIELSNIARQTIIPYISEVFLNQSRESQSSEKTAYSRCSTSIVRKSLRRSSRRQDQQQSLSLRRELRMNLKIERLAKLLALRKGFDALVSCFAVESLPLCNFNEQAELSLSSIAQYVGRAPLVRSRALQLTIIAKYVRKVALFQSFQLMKQPLIRSKLERIQQYFSNQLKHSFTRILAKFERRKRSLGLATFLQTKLQVKRTQLLLRAFTKIYDGQYRHSLAQTNCMKGLGVLSLFISQKQLKLLFFVFSRLRYRSSQDKKKFTSTEAIRSPKHQSQAGELKKFLQGLHTYVDNRIRMSTSEDQSSFIHEFLNTSFREPSYQTPNIREGKAFQNKEADLKEQPVLEIGSSLSFDIICEDKCIEFFGTRAVNKVPSKALRPLCRDFNADIQDRLLASSIDKKSY